MRLRKGTCRVCRTEGLIPAPEEIAHELADAERIAETGLLAHPDDRRGPFWSFGFLSNAVETAVPQLCGVCQWCAPILVGQIAGLQLAARGVA